MLLKASFYPLKLNQIHVHFIHLYTFKKIKLKTIFNFFKKRIKVFIDFRFFN